MNLLTAGLLLLAGSKLLKKKEKPFAKHALMMTQEQQDAFRKTVQDARTGKGNIITTRQPVQGMSPLLRSGAMNEMQREVYLSN